MKKNLYSGQTLFEVVAAIGLIGVALIAVVGLLVQGQRNTNIAKDQSQGTRFIIEASEWLRSERDQDWVQFRNHADPARTYCLNVLNDTAWSTGQCTANAVDQPFSRQVTLSWNAATPCEVRADIKLIVNGVEGPDTQVVSNRLANWKGGC